MNVGPLGSDSSSRGPFFQKTALATLRYSSFLIRYLKFGRFPENDVSYKTISEVPTFRFLPKHIVRVSLTVRASMTRRHC